MDWDKRKVLVTGGASFIGSHLVDGLIERGAVVRVVEGNGNGHLRDQAMSAGMDFGVLHLRAIDGGLTPDG